MHKRMHVQALLDGLHENSFRTLLLRRLVNDDNYLIRSIVIIGIPPASLAPFGLCGGLLPVVHIRTKIEKRDDSRG